MLLLPSNFSLLLIIIINFLLCSFTYYLYTTLFYNTGWYQKQRCNALFWYITSIFVKVGKIYSISQYQIFTALELQMILYLSMNQIYTERILYNTIKDNTAESVISTYEDHFHAGFGGYVNILSDNGTEVKNTLFTEIAKQLGVENDLNSSMSPSVK